MRRAGGGDCRHHATRGNSGHVEVVGPSPSSAPDLPRATRTAARGGILASVSSLHPGPRLDSCASRPGLKRPCWADEWIRARALQAWNLGAPSASDDPPIRPDFTPRFGERAANSSYAQPSTSELAVLLICAAVVLYLGFFPAVALPGQGVGILRIAEERSRAIVSAAACRATLCDAR